MSSTGFAQYYPVANAAIENGLSIGFKKKRGTQCGSVVYANSSAFVAKNALESHDAKFAFQTGERVGAQAGAGSILFIILPFFCCDVGQDLFFEPLGAIPE
jgi:hypothetical protein